MHTQQCQWQYGLKPLGIADKVAGSHKTQLQELLPQTEWFEISALAAMNTSPQANEFYFGDHAGRPTAFFFFKNKNQ